ncbi:ankyrin repeat-containing domain protein [Pestalotiopsis sp. NC0098]|nr:ankyrin repeat-containing domain protein [Pestalotiopsis sp. NC0098]
MATADGYNEIAAMLAEQGAVKDNLSVIREILHECPDNATRLIYAGFDIHGRYLGKRQTALHYAAERGFERVVSALLENGASVDVYDLDRCTPLHLAARKGRVACVRLLLDSGADVLAEDRNGDWPLDVAEDCHHVLIETILRENMQRLLEQLQSQSKSKSSDPDIGDKSATEAIAEDWEVESNGPEIPVISVSPV